jgi:RND family efflux transporter MFP subunit
MPRPLIACLVLLTLLLVAAAAMRQVMSGPGQEAMTHASASGSARAPPRAAEMGPRGDFLGVIIPSASVEIVSKTEGQVAAIEVQVGARVQAGAPLVRLDLHPLRKELAIAQAALQTARAQEQLAQVALSEARDRTQRYTHPKLVSLQAVPEEEIAAAGFQEKSAAARLQSAQAQVQEQVARVEQIQQRIEDAVIKAPFEGVIADRYLDPGAQTSPSRPILRLLGAGGLRVRFAIPEDELRGVTPGAPIQVRLPREGPPLTGQVENVSPEVDSASRMIIALARLDVPPGADVPAGIVVRVRVGPPGERAALAVPETP